MEERNNGDTKKSLERRELGGVCFSPDPPRVLLPRQPGASLCFPGVINLSCRPCPFHFPPSCRASPAARRLQDAESNAICKVNESSYWVTFPKHWSPSKGCIPAARGCTPKDRSPVHCSHTHTHTKPAALHLNVGLWEETRVPSRARK